jgi:arylformamidase
MQQSCLLSKPRLGSMAAIDYEAEFDNRARVPEHPAIMARWEEESRAYRAAAGEDGHAELGISYGSSARQIIDLFSSPAAGGTAPLTLFMHGGYWRSLEPAIFSHVARGLNGHGITMAVAGYDLCPQVKIPEIVNQIRRACTYLWRRFGRRVVVIGHSAGGHLAACMLATDWKSISDDLPADLVPAACAFSGLFDLEPLVGISMNEDFKLDEATAHDMSPLYWPPPQGRVFDAVVGAEESNEFRRQSRAITERWGKAGVVTHCEEGAGLNHFTVIGALSDPQSSVVIRLAELCRRT